MSLFHKKQTFFCHLFSGGKDNQITSGFTLSNKRHPNNRASSTLIHQSATLPLRAGCPVVCEHGVATWEQSDHLYVISHVAAVAPVKGQLFGTGCHVETLCRCCSVKLKTNLLAVNGNTCFTFFERWPEFRFIGNQIRFFFIKAKEFEMEKNLRYLICLYNHINKHRVLPAIH